jgi:hypothetical protein
MLASSDPSPMAPTSGMAGDPAPRATGERVEPFAFDGRHVVFAVEANDSPSRMRTQTSTLIQEENNVASVPNDQELLALACRRPTRCFCCL